MSRDQNNSIIALDRFIQATRDSGYKSTAGAAAELADNSVQAAAKHIDILIRATEMEDFPIEIAVLDDGAGMDAATLRESLRFGGSSRFNDRSGFGRYGMGLPNASLSQARRVEVYTWQNGTKPVFSFLDVDEIAARKLVDVPKPEVAQLPKEIVSDRTRSGTLILWRRCDRLDHRRISTLARKMAAILGRVFRYSIYSGVTIRINGEVIAPIDPLMVHERSLLKGGKVFGEPMRYQIEAHSPEGRAHGVGEVTVTFSELPFHELHDLSNEEKRQRGIASGAGVSVVRAGREIDYGWFFMGNKRRENYDDWWRCEVQFGPILDEAFGLTHTKQQVRPQEYLLEVLSPDIEQMAKVLNSRVRRSSVEMRNAVRNSDIEATAAVRDRLLKPLPAMRPDARGSAMLRTLTKSHPSLKVRASQNGHMEYRLVEDPGHDRVHAGAARGSAEPDY